MAERAEDRFVFIALAADGNGIAEPAYVQVHDPGKVLPAVVLAVQTGHIKPASGTAGFLAVKKGEARRVSLFLQVLCKVNEDAEGGGVIIGANDNAAALCILIDLAKDLKEKGHPARFAFFDGEETGCSGSRLYVSCLDSQDHRRQDLTGVVNLDVCGFGDTIAICGKGNENKPVFRPFCQKLLLDRYNAQVLKYLPKSDEASFAGSRIPALSLCAIPRWDIQYLKAMATYGDGFLGRPPEFDMMMGQMEVSTTMHGGYRDHPDYVESEAMSQIYGYLSEAVAAPPAGRKKLFGLL